MFIKSFHCWLNMNLFIQSKMGITEFNHKFREKSKIWGKGHLDIAWEKFTKIFSVFLWIKYIWILLTSYQDVRKALTQVPHEACLCHIWIKRFWIKIWLLHLKNEWITGYSIKYYSYQEIAHLTHRGLAQFGFSLFAK